MSVKHPSILQMWQDFTSANDQYNVNEIPMSFYFCDNQKDADECAELVVKGIKQATAGSQWSYEKNNEDLPKVGDVFIVTNWIGEAKAIVETTKIEKTPYNQITETFARIEGEGDKSLEYWRKVHWAFFSREMEPSGAAPTEDMIIVCEHFSTIWPKIQS